MQARREAEFIDPVLDLDKSGAVADKGMFSADGIVKARIIRLEHGKKIAVAPEDHFASLSLGGEAGATLKGRKIVDTEEEGGKIGEGHFQPIGQTADFREQGRILCGTDLCRFLAEVPLLRAQGEKMHLLGGKTVRAQGASERSSRVIGICARAVMIHDCSPFLCFESGPGSCSEHKAIKI